MQDQARPELHQLVKLLLERDRLGALHETTGTGYDSDVADLTMFERKRHQAWIVSKTGRIVRESDIFATEIERCRRFGVQNAAKTRRAIVDLPAKTLTDRGDK